MSTFEKLLICVAGAALMVAVILVALPSSGSQDDHEFVLRNRANPDPEVQDRVGRARIRLAYDEAKKGDFKGARAALLETAREYKGTGQMSSDFGGVKDGAAYQAAATYNAEGKRAEAIRAFRRFLVEYPLSPLVHGAHKRLVAMDPDQSGDYDALLQRCMDRQALKAKADRVSCGPKCLGRVLEALGKPATSYEELAKLCKTTEAGTTMKALRQAMVAKGIDAHGYRLNRHDLLKLEHPAIVLSGDHYVVLLRVSPTISRVYDPAFDSESEIPFPDAKSEEFTLLATEKLDLEKQ